MEHKKHIEISFKSKVDARLSLDIIISCSTFKLLDFRKKDNFSPKVVIEKISLRLVMNSWELTSDKPKSLQFANGCTIWFNIINTRDVRKTKQKPVVPTYRHTYIFHRKYHFQTNGLYLNRD